jgi:hypothetical protein
MDRCSSCSAAARNSTKQGRHHTSVTCQMQQSAGTSARDNTRCALLGCSRCCSCSASTSCNKQQPVTRQAPYISHISRQRPSARRPLEQLQRMEAGRAGDHKHLEITAPRGMARCCSCSAGLTSCGKQQQYTVNRAVTKGQSHVKCSIDQPPMRVKTCGGAAGL